MRVRQSDTPPEGPEYRYHVTLDGEVVGVFYWADDEAGEVLALDLDENGQPQTEPITGSVLTKVFFGVVEIMVVPLVDPQ